MRTEGRGSADWAGFGCRLRCCGLVRTKVRCWSCWRDQRGYVLLRLRVGLTLGAMASDICYATGRGEVTKTKLLMGEFVVCVWMLRLSVAHR